MKIDSLSAYVGNQIFKYEFFLKEKYDKHTFHLDYENKVYRQDCFVRLIRDVVPYFALTEQEFAELEQVDINRTAWSRISKARRDKKGDYGELLLYLILQICYDVPKFVTKVRLRSSLGMQINGYDCAHFTIEDEEPVLWLGESKFHQSFSTALTKSLESLEEHCKILYTSDEMSILRSNIELNKNSGETYEKLVKVFKGLSIDKIRFKIPVLLTYDSNIVKSNEDIDDKFRQEFTLELEELYKKIEEKDIKSELKKIEFVFLLFPFHTVAEIKEKLETIENLFR